VDLWSGIKILGTGSSVPNFEVPNDEFSKFIETDDTWITERTGIKTRRFISGDETSLSLCNDVCLKPISSAVIN